MVTASDDIPILRTSERTAFKRCAWRWFQEYRMGYRPKGVQADALWFGIGIHEALGNWYQKGKRRGPHPADTFQYWAGDEMSWAKTYLDDGYDAPVWEDAVELGIAMLEGYVDFWGKDSQWQILAIEQPFSLKINRGGKPIVRFQSRWDGVFRDLADGEIYLLETKTAAQVILSYLELDDQGGSYWAAACQVLRAKGVLKPNEDIAGIQYNFLRKAMPDDRPVNKDGQRTNKPTKEHYLAALRSIGIGTVEQSGAKSGPIAIDKAKLVDLTTAAEFAQLNVIGDASQNQPAPLFVRPDPIFRTKGEQKSQLDRIADEVMWMNAIRSGTLPVTKTPTKDCPRCPLWIPCQLDERGNPAFADIIKAEFQQIDPYADYRESAATGGI
jgi:PD-(D/E)XK nuclease superfamily